MNMETIVISSKYEKNDSLGDEFLVLEHQLSDDKFLLVSASVNWLEDEGLTAAVVRRSLIHENMWMDSDIIADCNIGLSFSGEKDAEKAFSQSLSAELRSYEKELRMMTAALFMQMQHIDSFAKKVADISKYCEVPLDLNVFDMFGNQWESGKEKQHEGLEY